MQPDTLTVVLNDLLAACVDAYTLPAAAPALRFVSHGQATWYGEQLAVWVVDVKSTKPYPLTRLSAVKASVVPAADLMVELVRSCWPLPQVQSPAKALPDPTTITAAAMLLATDASTIFGHIAQLATSGQLFPSLPTVGTSEDVALGTMLPASPQNQLAGWRWPISVKLAVQ